MAVEHSSFLNATNRAGARSCELICLVVESETIICWSVRGIGSVHFLPFFRHGVSA
jgi:hypothetical protein